MYSSTPYLCSRVSCPINITKLSWISYGHEFTPEERSKLIILNNRFYRHKSIRVNYTTYDVRQDQDALDTSNHADIMTLPRTDSEDTIHPFEYALIIGVFHADVVLNIPGATKDPESY